MITFDTETIERIVEGSPKRNGATNLFFPLNDEIGVKASLDEWVRDSNYETQKRASEFDLGPLTYGTVDFVYLGKQWHGYLTEIVETISLDDVYTIDNYNGERSSLVKELKDTIGFVFRDDHHGNIGIKNGKFVCIDFDSIETLQNINPERLEFLEKVSELC